MWGMNYGNVKGKGGAAGGKITPLAGKGGAGPGMGYPGAKGAAAPPAWAAAPKGGAAMCGAPPAWAAAPKGGAAMGAHAPAGKGGCKGAYGGKSATGELVMRGETNWKPVGDGMLYQAISEAVAAMGHLETEWDAEKLEKKLREYFNKAGKNMSYHGNLKQLVEQYADNAMSSIFAGLGERDWLFGGEVDFLLVLDAGIKDYLPGYMLKSVSQEAFEQLVLSSYEKAFDEQRFCPILTAKLPELVSGPKIKKKVWNAIDQGRKDAWAEGHTDLESFARSWVNNAAKHLGQSTGGSPDGTLPSDQMVLLFTALWEAGGLPTALSLDADLPVHILEETVTMAYGDHTDGEWHPDADPSAKKLKGVFSSWGPANYGGKGERLFANRAEVAAKKAAG